MWPRYSTLERSITVQDIWSISIELSAEHPKYWKVKKACPVHEANSVNELSSALNIITHT